MAVDALARALAAGKVPVSAYEMAVKAGYTGTEEQFAEDMGNSGTNATNAANSATAAAASATTAANAAGNLAPAYSASATYAVGDHVLYDGGYYVCNTAITTAEAWTAAHWTAAKVGPEITDLKTQIINSNKGIQTFSGLGNFQHYGLQPDGSFLTTQQYRVSNNDPMTFNRPIVVSVKNGYKWGYIPFVDGTAGTWSGWKTSDYTIPSGTSFVVQIARVTEVTSEVADVNEFVSALTFDSELKTQLSSEENQALVKTWNGERTFAISDFARGGLYQGNLTSAQNKISSNHIMSFSETLSIEIADGFLIDINWFDENDQYTSYSSSINVTYNFPANQKLKMTIRRSTDDPAEIADIGEFLNAISFTADFLNGIYNDNEILQTGLFTLKGRSNFQHYILNETPTFLFNSKYRVSCTIPITFTKPITSVVEEGFRWGYIPYSNGSFGSWSGFLGSGVTLPAGFCGIFQIARVVEDTNEIANVDEFLNALKFTMAFIEKSKSLVDFNNINWVTYRGTQVDVIDNDVKVTAISANGYQLADAFIPLPSNAENAVTVFFDGVEGNGKLGLRIAGSTDGENKTYIRFCDQGYTIYDMTGYNYIVLSFYVNTENPTIPVNSYGIYHKPMVYISNEVLPYSTPITAVDYEARYPVEGSGNCYYSGEHINLDDQYQKRNACKSALWLDITSTAFPDISELGFKRHQSMEIYNNYVFLFMDLGGCAVFDYETKSYIGYFATSPTTGNHQNSAQFTNLYYDSSDEFPILMVSRCGNSNGTDTIYDSCLFYRVERDNDSFTFTLIKEVNIDFRTYGTDYVYNKATNEIIMFGFENGNYQVTTNNPIYYYKWKSPTVAELKGDSLITFSKANAIGTYTTDFMVFQAGYAVGNIIYIGMQKSSNIRQIWAVSVDEQKVNSKINLLEMNEIEGVCVYNGKMYVSHRYPDNSMPIKIYELTF